MSNSNSDDAIQQRPLGTNFRLAQKQLEQLTNSPLPSSGAEYQKQAQALIDLLTVCLEQIKRLDLFSSNETPDDYSTSELKLILTDAYLGESLQKLNSSAHVTRLSLLEKSRHHYDQFLSLCQNLGILQPAERKILELVKAHKPLAADPGASRMQKIERFKAIRAMSQEITALESRLATATASDDTDEAEREYAVKLIRLKIQQVIDDLSMLESELDMARQMEQRRADPDRRQNEEERSKEWRLDPQTYRVNPATGQPNRPVFNAKGQPMQPFVLTNDRQKIKDSVFRPGWALPTMTVDQYLQQEQERGNIISGGGKEPDEKPEIDDNDHDALDTETMKQREWDDFKDNNPKGMGNRGGNRG
ncbi:Type 2A phosphatase-associated protein 42 [Linderina macrospora]|uniref:Type 2A phosphatase-associated protein 42 n=1 Tax=Linderina macrospora TaxID=4868 RepID=A0ACC1J1R1_9FUNG|nr:Type 2A phosphatase-associated protein 42 [Linderina macrospora]